MSRDDYEYDDPLESYGAGGFDIDEHVDDEDFVSSVRDDGMETLNLKDYNLNSPIITDGLVNFIKFFQGFSFENIYKKGWWESEKRILKANRINIHAAKQADLHKICGLIYRWNMQNMDYAKSILKEVNEDAKDTWEITRSYIKGWLGTDMSFEDIRLDPEAMRYLEAYLFWYDMVLVLNASSLAERKELSKLREKWRFDEKGGVWTVRSDYGDWIVGSNTFYSSTFRVLFDTQFALMIKDVFAARLQTCVSLLTYKKSGGDMKINITLAQEMYDKGDKLLMRHGNETYDIIKMLEPACNLELCERARVYRRLVPDFPSFREFVQEGTEELERDYAGSREFLQMPRRFQNIEGVLIAYGSFRHWGHPAIDYFEGLKSLHSNVTLEKQIDTDYANALASDLALMILRKKFVAEKVWYVDINRLHESHMLYEHVKNSTWPTLSAIHRFGDNWHKLPLKKCFNIPDVIDPATLYSDKSHSMNRSEVLAFIQQRRPGGIPTKKVLKTLIQTKATIWGEFLQQIDTYGLTLDDLIIGLKGKEREIKRKGRFYSLMSWNLRQYFVVTEYLIKKHYVPLFEGLTMADDMSQVMKKLLKVTEGQGLDSYDQIGIANHLDYEKWNNHQRHEATHPVFTVMDNFLGYKHLISRTHEFFQSSLVYYKERPDLMRVVGNTLINSTDKLVTWDGQAGGFEGLRQKGWSILNLLIIQRESKRQNVKINVLAQGDNQVICTQFRLQTYRTEEELRRNLEGVCYVNRTVMEGIHKGTAALGLTINRAETMQSADYLCYGKVPVFRGVIYPLVTKRWARLTCVNNDQLPSLGSVGATASTNALMVAHFSSSPIESICMYNWASQFVRVLLFRHNPAMRRKVVLNFGKHPKKRELVRLFNMASTYVDPILGGVYGMSLSRTLIRKFPDGLTESLAFWKIVHDNTDDHLVKQFACAVGNPKISEFQSKDLAKLIENPISLNIKGGINVSNLLKMAIRKYMFDSVESIQNDVIKAAFLFLKNNEEAFMSHLASIIPRFPRLLSSYKSATGFGIGESTLGLVENSRTFRSHFGKRKGAELDKLIIKSEYLSIASLENIALRTLRGAKMWDCSSSHADTLRFHSWGGPIVGATVPHPLEMFRRRGECVGSCRLCDGTPEGQSYIMVSTPRGMADYADHRGFMPAYLGSRTAESSSIFRPYEKEAVDPFLKRLSKLRDTINWFIRPDSNLARAIFSVFEGITGEDWSRAVEGYSRTGSAQHRFSCDRQSAGGYYPGSPAKTTYMFATTDHLEVGSKNYDFMFQAPLIFAQLTEGEIVDQSVASRIGHYHLSCQECLREIEPIWVESALPYVHPDISAHVLKWKPEGTPWGRENKSIELTTGDWSRLSQEEGSYHIGLASGFLFGDCVTTGANNIENLHIFPLSLRDKLHASMYMNGLMEGILRASALDCTSRRSVFFLNNHVQTLLGSVLTLIDRLSADSGFVNLCRGGGILEVLSASSHRMPASYPAQNSDLGALCRSYLKLKAMRVIEEKAAPFLSGYTWVFSELVSPGVLGPFILGSHLRTLILRKNHSSAVKRKIVELKDVIAYTRGQEKNLEGLRHLCNDFRLTPQEIRHSVKSYSAYDPALSVVSSSRKDGWGREWSGNVVAEEVLFQSQREPPHKIDVPRISCPLISGLRTAQLATGAHYKIRSIMRSLKILYQDFLVGGDGSGGMTSALMRLRPNGRCIFNTLLECKDVFLKGSTPDPPAAIMALPQAHRSQCVNLKDLWKYSSDLSHQSTWEYFLVLKKERRLNIDLMVFDMEVREEKILRGILENLKTFYPLLLGRTGGTIIFKSYVHWILSEHASVVRTLGPFFERVRLVTTEVSSSYTSELYVVLECPRSNFSDIYKHVSEDSLLSAIQIAKVFKTPEEEFARAIRISQHNLLIGVPNRLVPMLSMELGALLHRVGLEPGTAHHLSLTGHTKIGLNYSDYLTWLSWTVCNSVIRVTAGNREEAITPPSDPAIEKMFCWLIGTGFAMSIDSGDPRIFVKMQSYIDRGIFFFWGRVKFQDLVYPSWSTQAIKPVQKTLYVDRSMALIGQVIRILRRMRVQGEWPSSSKPNLYEALRRSNKGNVRAIKAKRTGVFEFFNISG